MKDLNQSTLNFSIPLELECIQKKYAQLKRKNDLDSQQYLYQMLVDINRNISDLEEESDYLALYSSFDR
ncbi:MAG: hypothetical protein AAGE84_00105 [Cyanobacteria bacterium P01_G01_bin.39]